jgi:hypothetical protein
MGGHQLSVHTWSHPALTTLSTEQIIAELGWTMKAIKDITGVTPNTMRPPFGDIDGRIRAICKAMGLTPILWTSAGGSTFDTNDWRVPAGQSAESVLRTFESILGRANSLDTGFIVLAHDLYQQSVDLATGYIVPNALARGFNLQNIVTCLKKPLSEAYIETSSNSTTPNATGTMVTNSGTTPTSPAPSASASRTPTNDALSISAGAHLTFFIVGLCALFL